MQKYPNDHKVTEKGREHEAFEAIYEDKISLSAFFHNAELTIESTEFLDGIVNIYARGSLDYGICPYCGTKSSKVHSRYIRHISDLPVFGNTTIIHLRMRKFFCSNPSCKFHTFAEQPGIEVFRYRRRTRRCEVVESTCSQTFFHYCRQNTFLARNTAQRVNDIKRFAPYATSCVY